EADGTFRVDSRSQLEWEQITGLAYTLDPACKSPFSMTLCHVSLSPDTISVKLFQDAVAAFDRNPSRLLRGTWLDHTTGRPNVKAGRRDIQYLRLAAPYLVKLADRRPLTWRMIDRRMKAVRLTNYRSYLMRMRPPTLRLIPAAYRDNCTPCSRDLISAVRRARRFTRRIVECLRWQQPDVLHKAVDRYGKFLALMAVEKKAFLVPTLGITPSLFEQFESGPLASQTEDEWTFCEKLGRKEAERQLKHHWKTWVTKADFRRLADAGINHVRIPVGYWAVEKHRHEPWVQGQLEYLARAIRWADHYDIQVIIDLHGVPGSQNGFDNSGKKGAATWTSQLDNVHRSVRALRRLARTFSADEYDNVVGIELVNEPAHWSLDMNVVRKYYEESIDMLREHMADEQSIVVADAFLPIHQWNDFMAKHRDDNLILDTHHYQVF
ncbi:glycoside hydrolase superfamily, partial [Syncephalis pseudoplumigaleata]